MIICAFSNLNNSIFQEADGGRAEALPPLHDAYDLSFLLWLRSLPPLMMPRMPTTRP